MVTDFLIGFAILVGLAFAGIALIRGFFWTVRRVWGEEGLDWLAGPLSRLFLAIWGGGLGWAVFDHTVALIIFAIVGWMIGSHVDESDRRREREKSRDRALALLRRGELSKEDESELLRIIARMRGTEELKPLFGRLSTEELQRFANKERE